MYIEPNASVEIRNFLSISAQYFGIEEDVEIACSDRGGVPFFGYMGADRVLQCDEPTGQRYA